MVAKIWIKFELHLCSRPNVAWNKSSTLPNRPPNSHDWACRSATMVLRGCSYAEVVLLMCMLPTMWATAAVSGSIALAVPSVLKLNPKQCWPNSRPTNMHYVCLTWHRETVLCLLQLLMWSNGVMETGASTRALGCGRQGRGRRRHTRACSGTNDRWVQWLAKYKQMTSQSLRLNYITKVLRFTGLLKSIIMMCWYCNNSVCHCGLEMRIPVTFTNSLQLVTRDIGIHYWVFITLIVTGSNVTTWDALS